MKRYVVTSAALALIAAGSTQARAATVTDATGDFLPTYTGPLSADLDVTSFSVTYNSASMNFLLAASLAGAVDPAVAGLYVIGADTGTGTLAPFAALGQGNVRFNQTIVLRKDGTGNVGATTLDPGAITISGNTISALVPLSLLPSTGFAPQNYGFNLWPRSGLGMNAQISDFSPENATLAAVAPIPEPATWGFMLLGFAAAGYRLRRRRAITQLACA